MNHVDDIQVCGKTDIGLKRKRNEDHYLIVDKPDDGSEVRCLGMLFAVADGMGGHPAGDVASRLACEGLKEFYYDASPCMRWLCSLSKSMLLKHLKRAVERTQNRISNFESEHQKCSGFGTTLSAMVLLKDRVLISHVGDSRIYRLRDNNLQRLTTDDTFVQEMVDMGELDPEQAAESPYRHVLTQALGVGYEKIYATIKDVHEGDTFLLCSDGLHDLVAEDEIKKILNKTPTTANVCDQLIKAALDHGGRDNVTVIVIKSG